MENTSGTQIIWLQAKVMFHRIFGRKPKLHWQMTTDDPDGSELFLLIKSLTITVSINANN